MSDRLCAHGKSLLDECDDCDIEAINHALANSARLEAEIRADERAKCVAEIKAFAQARVDRWTSITPDAEDDHKAEGWAILMAAAHIEKPTPPTPGGKQK